MATLQTIHLERLPATHTIHVALFHTVENASFLHQQLLAGNTDFEYAFIDASVIISTLHALAATYRAVNDLLEKRLRSRNVHSEIVFCLSPNNNIAQAFRTFGITPTTTNLLVIKILSPSASTHLTPESIQEHLSTSIEGTQVPFSDDFLAAMTDWERVRKAYKLDGIGALGGSGNGKGVKRVDGMGLNGVGRVKGEEEERKEMEVLVLGSMALRGATN